MSGLIRFSLLILIATALPLKTLRASQKSKLGICNSFYATSNKFNQEELSHAEILQDFGDRFAENGYIILYRGQFFRSRTLRAPELRYKGLSASKRLHRKLLEHVAQQRERFKGYYLDGETNLKYLYDWYLNFNDDQLAAVEHVFSSYNPTPYLSASSSPQIAQGDFSQGSAVRYVYVLKVPVDRAIDVHSPLRARDIGFAREMEYSILHEATDTIIGLYDKEKKTFLKLRKD